jgi:hypothetical protein
LINALEEYKNNFYIWSEHKRQEYWCTIIGDIQRDIPVHVAQEYCVPSSANHHAINAINKDGNEDVFQENFKNSNYYARRSLRFYDYTSGENRCWFPLPSFLGRDYAIAGEWGVAKNYIFFEQGGFKKEWPNQTAPTGGQELINLLSVQIELKAVTTLAKIRVDEFNQFEEELDMVQKRLFIKNNPKQQY